MLVDHITTSKSDFRLARIDQHPSIEIRLFNPFANRELRGPELLFSLRRLNNRMHNMAFIVDNAIVIVGGRNIADNYFGMDTAENFGDLDLAMVGIVVQDVSASFDEDWNSEVSVPVSAVIDEQFTQLELEEGSSSFMDGLLYRASSPTR